MNRISKVTIIFLLISSVIAVNTINAQTGLTADVYASYFGGSGDDENIYIAVDGSGNVILAGHSYSTNLPVEPAGMTSKRGGSATPDGFITKFNPEMNDIIFSTYLGGTDYDEIKSVSVDSIGNIYVTGVTSSTDFPITANALYKTYNGGSKDAFITKLGPDGIIKYSTYLGGSNEDVGNCISVIDTSTICVTGYTKSANFPKQTPLYDYRSGYDVFLSKINISDDSLVFSTYVGGSGTDMPLDMKTDKSGNIYVSGSTVSSDFPTKSAYMPVYGGRDDGFIFKLGSNGELIFSTFVGGTGDDGIFSIDVSDKNEVYFTGGSSDSHLTCSPNAFSSAIGDIDIIIGKLNITGDTLLYFSYFGGTNIEYGKKICYIGNNSIIISGNTFSSNFPITVNAKQNTLYGQDIFISVLNIAQKEKLYSSFLGGSGEESVFDLRMVNDSIIYLSGTSNSSNFPVSSDAYTKSFQGVTDAIFARIKFYKSPTSVREEKSKGAIEDFRLNQNYPNPFNPTTNIGFRIANSGFVNLKVFDVLGREVATLVNEKKAPGSYIVQWNAAGMPSGIYFYRVQAGTFTETKKLVLVK